MILVTGATGHLGNATIEFLLERGIEANQISALVRSTEKAQDLKAKGINLVIGNYDNYTSLVTAFKNIDKLFFVSSSDISHRLQQHGNVVKAAKEANVNYVVYTSFQRKDETEKSPLYGFVQVHILTDKWLKESGLTYTILKNNVYMDFIPFFIGNDVLETGTIYLPAGNGKISFALRFEMAEAAASILASSGHENKVYDFTNTEAYSYADVAKYITEATGKEINYVSPTAEEYTKALANTGISQLNISVALGQAQGEFDTTSYDLGNLLGRKPTILQDYLKTIYR
ncbi:MAG: SDR family oxidoreductase [Labilibaculum sp.]|nr:SDR family oxidoreductase [Labilibaculum sp.]